MNDRTRDLVIDSPSVGTVRVRLLLPAGFDTAPNRRWPVLYLLHGANDPGTYTCWTRSTDVAALTAGLPLLVVMPEGGMEGYYSNWFDQGRGGPPAWETFHLVELLAVLERDWRASDHPGNAAFVHRLSELGIPAEVDAYEAGTHDWPYWQRELHRALPGIMRALQL